MSDDLQSSFTPRKATRRGFLGQVGGAVAAGATVGPLLVNSASAADAATAVSEEGRVRHRVLGKTGLSVSEIGIGGHSWSTSRVPDGKGGSRKPTIDEAVEMIRTSMDMDVNFVDSCTPLDESSVPGEALKRLNVRDQFIVSIRVSHKMKGVVGDREEIYQWTEERLKLWQTDYVDLCLLCNSEGDTPQSGYWDMSYSIDALEKLKKEGKIRFTGFGCHFTPELFLEAIDKFGDYFDICSIPYNVRHRAAETVLPAAKKKNMGVITIKPFARGSLLKKRDLQGEDAGLPRDMIRFILDNEMVDICTCGVHTVQQVRENLSASWTGLTPDGRKRLGLAAATPCPTYQWLEGDWRYA
jgi:predicted aldo/keto reductase-like oxidoreductase